MSTLFQVGSIGRGRLAYTDGLTWLMKFDDLAYFSRFGSHRKMPLPIVFHDQAPDDKNGQFQAVVVIPFEPLAPPVFRRGLLWDADQRSSAASWLLRSARILLQTTVILTITVAYKQ